MWWLWNLKLKYTLCLIATFILGWFSLLLLLLFTNKVTEDTLPLYFQQNYFCLKVFQFCKIPGYLWISMDIALLSYGGASKSIHVMLILWSSMENALDCSKIQGTYKKAKEQMRNLLQIKLRKKERYISGIEVVVVYISVIASFSSARDLGCRYQRQFQKFCSFLFAF